MQTSIFRLFEDGGQDIRPGSIWKIKKLKIEAPVQFGEMLLNQCALLHPPQWFV
jgi:hypothetical protein